MFGVNKKAKLEKKYAKLLGESHKLSTVDRKASDMKLAEAEAVLSEIKKLEAKDG